ncbi:hypothetical protein ACFVIM_31555, partial [Streptomyces sp. NPDC057638]|uniref:hypothetical protein n=1 Tax=Streptomyces sp. NPDC057638 TaxID=3346190 RepID=UPI0036822554
TVPGAAPAAPGTVPGAASADPLTGAVPPSADPFAPAPPAPGGNAPTGPTSGPATGTMPVRPRKGAAAGVAGGLRATGAAGTGSAAGAPAAAGTAAGAAPLTGAPGGAAGAAEGRQQRSAKAKRRDAQGAPAGPGAAQAGPGAAQGGPGAANASGPGASGGPSAPGVPGGPAQAAPAPGNPGAPDLAAARKARKAAAPRLSDDTQILTPQRQVPPPPGGGDRMSDTMTTGMPVVTPERRPPFPAQSGPGGPGGPRPASGDFPAGPAAPAGPAGPAAPGAGESAAPAPSSRPAPPPAKKKGRSKLVLLGVGVVSLGAVAYGAGLLLNHSEVPKKTTVLGVDIGGGTKEQAVNKLQDALGKRASAPLELTIGGKKERLAPDKAGLSLDSQATVRGAAGSDYNPMSVVGSLFGGARVAEPVIVVDEEKLGAALTDLAGTSGSAVEGTITFEPGKAVAVPGKAGKALDVERSMLAVENAYRAQVEKGEPGAVELPVAVRAPKVTQAELDRAMKEFAEPAMSGEVTISAGGRSLPFGPYKSLPQILSMKADNGRLVDAYDKKAIEELMGSFFDGVMVTKDGKQEQLSADHVAQAMRDALRGKTSDERRVEIPLDGG